MGNIPFSIQINPGIDPQDIRITAVGTYIAPANAQLFSGIWGVDMKKLMVDWLNDNGFRNARVDRIDYDQSNLGDRIVDDVEAGSGIIRSDGSPSVLRPTATVNLHVVGSRIASISKETVLADHSILNNRGNTDPTNWSETLTYSLQDSVSVSWSRKESIGATVEVGVEVGGVNAKTSVSTSVEWGESHGTSKSNTVGLTHQLSGTLEPNELKVAAAVISKVLVNVRVQVAATIDKPEYGNSKLVFYGNADGRSGGQPYSASVWRFSPLALLDHMGAPYPYITSIMIPAGTVAEAEFHVVDIPDETGEAIDTALGTGRGYQQIYP